MGRINPCINIVATKNCTSLFCIEGLIKSIKYQIISGANKLIKFVIKNLKILSTHLRKQII